MLHLALLYAALASPVWEDREAASGALLRLVDRHPALYGPRLAAWGREAAEPEVIARLRRPVACYQRRLANDYVPKGVPVWPQVDMAPMETAAGDARCKALTQHWLFEAHEGDRQGPYWTRWRRGTERMARHLIAEGAAPDDVDRLLQRMWAIENRVRGDCGGPEQWRPPGQPGWEESEKWTKWEGGYPAPK